MVLISWITNVTVRNHVDINDNGRSRMYLSGLAGLCSECEYRFETRASQWDGFCHRSYSLEQANGFVEIHDEYGATSSEKTGEWAS